MSHAPTAAVTLKPRRAAPFWGRHPWVLEKAIARVDGSPADGDVVDLLSDDGRWIARGVFNSNSWIRVRLYSWEESVPLDDDFWRMRLASAIELRETLRLAESAGAARLVYSEADGLSGLIVDRYAGHLVVQPTALAMVRRLGIVAQYLRERLQPTSILLRRDSSTESKEGMQDAYPDVFDSSPTEPTEIIEHGVRYAVELHQGQKTGFYLDHRDNRRAAATYMRGRSVLDNCCYTGGFALAAAKLGRASEVLGIDTSSSAVETARQNAERNGLENVRFQQGDCFEALEKQHAEGRRFDAVILDPPKFATGKRMIDKALRAYHKLNLLAVQCLNPGGILVTCSCSGVVGGQDFIEMLFGVALKSRRDIKILEQHGAAADHPVSLTCLENAYLKCLICWVE